MHVNIVFIKQINPLAEILALEPLLYHLKWSNLKMDLTNGFSTSNRCQHFKIHIFSMCLGACRVYVKLIPRYVFLIWCRSPFNMGNFEFFDFGGTFAPLAVLQLTNGVDGWIQHVKQVLGPQTDYFWQVLVGWCRALCKCRSWVISCRSHTLQLISKFLTFKWAFVPLLMVQLTNGVDG